MGEEFWRFIRIFIMILDILKGLFSRELIIMKLNDDNFSIYLDGRDFYLKLILK